MVCLLMLLMPRAFADGPMRCGSKLVSTGMTTEEVRRYCGAPDSSQAEELPTRSGHRVVGTYVAELWTYRRGSGQAAATLRFEDNELKSINYER